MPDLFASSNFGIPVIFASFFPSVFLRLLLSLNLINCIICSTIPHFASLFKNACVGSYLEPNFSILVVSVSFVCDENAGFIIVALIKNTKLSFNNDGVTLISLSFFLI